MHSMRTGTPGEARGPKKKPLFLLGFSLLFWGAVHAASAHAETFHSPAQFTPAKGLPGLEFRNPTTGKFSTLQAGNMALSLERGSLLSTSQVSFHQGGKLIWKGPISAAGLPWSLKIKETNRFTGSQEVTVPDVPCHVELGGESHFEGTPIFSCDGKSVETRFRSSFQSGYRIGFWKDGTEVAFILAEKDRVVERVLGASKCEYTMKDCHSTTGLEVL